MPAPFLSVIVPTRNRGALLADAVRSIGPQALADGAAEVLVVDNASSDDTPAVAAGLAREFAVVRVVRSEDPGLLAGRHQGAAEARGDLLVYVDDDVVVAPGWITGYRAAFAEPTAGIVCGPCLPQWEGALPWWLDLFRQEVPGGWALFTLSLVDCGAAPRDVTALCVFGCNFAVRRGALRRCGGFHPDAVPREALVFRGDGESALAAAVAASGLRLRYTPAAAVRHRVPAERLTPEYFLWRSFCQGVSRSYAAFRRERGAGVPAGDEPAAPPSHSGRALRAVRKIARVGAARWLAERRLYAEVAAAAEAGERWHREALARDAALRAWVLRPDYLDDPRLPAPAGPVLQWRAAPSRAWEGRS